MYEKKKKINSHKYVNFIRFSVLRLRVSARAHEMEEKKTARNLSRLLSNLSRRFEFDVKIRNRHEYY